MSEDSPRASAVCTIVNRLGLHARAAGLVVQTADRFEAEITIAFDEQVANAKSILALMTLAAVRGARVHVEAAGADAEEAVRTLAALIANRFGEAD